MKTTIDLDRLNEKLEKILSWRDKKLEYEAVYMLFLAFHLVNINLSLYNFDVEKFNISLAVFNMCFLSRRLIKVYYLSLTTTNPLEEGPEFKIIKVLGCAYLMTFLHSLANLFIENSLSLIWCMLCPCILYMFLFQFSNSDGSNSLVQVILQLIETVYSIGYLPYKITPSTMQVNSPVYYQAFCTLAFCMVILHVGEFEKNRHIELNMFSLSLGKWRLYDKTGNVENWDNDTLYRKGDLVRHKGKVWKAINDINITEPGEAEVVFRKCSNEKMLAEVISVFCLIMIFIQACCLFLLRFHASSILSLASTLYITLRNNQVYQILKSL